MVNTALKCTLYHLSHSIKFVVILNCYFLRLQRNACQKKKEGPTYFPEIGPCQQADATLAKIPIPLIPPVPEVVICSSETHLPVYFDLETTGLGTSILNL